MEIRTSRFGLLQSDDVTKVDFPKGLIGLVHLRRFVAFRDSQRLTWLQSVRNPEWAMALVHPSLMIQEYRMSVTADQLGTVEYTEGGSIEALVVLNQVAGAMSMNLAAPVLINWDSGLGIQVQVNEHGHSVRQFLMSEALLRKSA